MQRLLDAYNAVKREIDIATRAKIDAEKRIAVLERELKDMEKACPSLNPSKVKKLPKKSKKKEEVEE